MPSASDEITDEFTKEELEAQMAAQLPDREAMAVASIDPASDAFVDLGLDAQPLESGADDAGTPEQEPLRGPETL